MAKTNFTRLFSYSGLHSHIMKSITAVLIVALMGCGGNPIATPVKPQSSSPSISAADVFSNFAETWTFISHCGNLLPNGTRGPVTEAHTWIQVLPQMDGSTIWHYTKDKDCAYWAPDVPQAELYFFLSKDASNAWYSTGGRIIMPQGCQWCLPNIHDPVDFTYSVAGIPGQPRPYLILADSGTSVDTVFPDAGGPATPWITKMYVRAHLQTNFLLSEQWEGNALHADGTPCGHERWWFKPGRGLWKIEPLDQGACIDVDPLLNLERLD